MIWARRIVVFGAVVLLVVSLIAGALAYGLKSSVDNQTQIEGWLGQSHFYSAAANDAINRAEQSTSSVSSGSVTLSLNDPTIQQIAHQTISPQIAQQYTSQILTSNYGWLQGKTSSPNFSIDVSSLKQKFAIAVGQAVQKQLQSLPGCSLVQLSQLQSEPSIDVFDLPCSPGSSFDPQAVASHITQSINGSNLFLSNTTLTPTNLYINQTASTTPYYEHFKTAPQAYRWLQRLPVIAAIVVILTVLGVMMAAPRRRRGLSYVTISLVLAAIGVGVGITAGKSITRSLQRHISADQNISSLQKSLNNFLQTIDGHVNHQASLFLAGYLILAFLCLVVLVTLRFRRQAGDAKPLVTAREPLLPSKPTAIDKDDLPPDTRETYRRPDRRVMDQNKNGKSSRRPPKPPRLIQ